jgi:hypothetical protein
MVGFDFEAPVFLLESEIKSRESTHVGGLCSINDNDAHHEPGR